MFFALLSLALLDRPSPQPAWVCIPTDERPALPEACPPPHAARGRTPGSSRRRFRDCLEDDDDSDGRGRTPPPITVLPPCGKPPCPTPAHVPRPGMTRRLAAVLLIYALCTLRI